MRLLVCWYLLGVFGGGVQSAGFQSAGSAEADTLRVMKEAPLGSLTAREQAFRLVWLRSFHPPVLVHLERQGGQRWLRVKMLSRPWGSSPAGVVVGRLVVEERIVVSPLDWDRLARLREAGFWRQAADEPGGPGGVDGADWIIEGVSWGEHHLVRRWTPQDGPFRELGLAMLRLSGLRLAPRNIY